MGATWKMTIVTDVASGAVVPGKLFTVKEKKMNKVRWTVASCGLRFVLCSTALVLAGCAAVPTLEYNKIEKPTQLRGDEIDTFYLQASRITLERGEISKTADGKATVTVVVTSRPIEFADFKFALRKADPIGVRTSLNLTKIENSDLIKEAGTEVVDNRIETIKKVAAGVTTLTTFKAEKELDPASLPIQFDDPAKNVSEEGGVVHSADKRVVVTVGPKPVDALKVSDLPTPLVTQSLLYAACRTATVEYLIDGKRHQAELKISDPRYVQRVAFPVKGKITMHSQCGVSVSSEKETGVATEAALFEAIAEQAKALKEALDKKGDGK
jgi:hypothetical protein